MTDLATPAPGALRPVADRVLPRRQRAGGAVQLALRAPARGDVRPADRGHRRGAQPAGVDRRDHRRARLARDVPRRGPVLPVGAGGGRTKPRSRRCGPAVRSTPARARARRSTSGRGSGRRPATPRRATTGTAATSGWPGGRGGPCASGRPTRAWCGWTTSCAARWSSPSARSRTSSA